jgi:hypothetical protein
MSNDNTLEGTEDWCAIESTDPAIQQAREVAWWREHDLRYRAMWREAWQVICAPEDTGKGGFSGMAWAQ